MARAISSLVLGSAIALALTLALVGCKRPSAKPGPEVGSVDAGAAAPVASALRDGGSAIAAVVDAGGPPVLNEPPLSSGDFELVALGKTDKSALIWLVALGSRVWLSAKGTDAYADGAGELAPGPDLLKGVPYEWGKQHVDVHGRWPRLVALRTNVITTRADPSGLTAFVYGDGGWKPAGPLVGHEFPHAVVTWADGILIVHSQVARNASATYLPDTPGTTFQHVAWDGTVSVPAITVERPFMAWDAASDGTTLTLLGARGHVPRKNDDLDTARNISVARGTLARADGGGRAATMATTEVQTGVRVSLESYGSRVRESGAFSFLAPPRSLTATETEAWKPSPQTFWFLDRDKPRPRRLAVDQSCTVGDAWLVAGVLYAVTTCYSEGDKGGIVRMGIDDKVERLRLPGLVRERGVVRPARPKEPANLRCEPEHLVLREPDDLWSTAICSGDEDGGSISLAAVFRRGRPQPLVRF